MPKPQEILDLLMMLILLSIEGACLIFYGVMTAFSYRLVARTWNRGLLFGAVVSVLWLPLALLAVFGVDLKAIQADLSYGAEIFIRFFLVFLVLIGLVVLVPLRAAYYHVAKSEWSLLRGDFDLALLGPRRSRLLGISVGMAAGLVNLIVALVVFHYFQVKEPLDPEFTRLFPGYAQMSPAVLAVPLACFVVAAAVVEELIFRGGILGFLLRISRNNTALAWVFITFVAFIWALLHYPNTNSPVLKIMQIFTLGIALGATTRQWGLSSAIAGHVTLNIGAVIANIVFPDL